MVDGIKTVLTAERKREYEKARGAGQALASDPEALMEKKLGEPLKLDQGESLLPAQKENWKKRRQGKDVRPEGFDYVMVRRNRETGRFTPGSRNILGKKKRRPA